MEAATYAQKSLEYIQKSVDWAFPESRNIASWAKSRVSENSNHHVHDGLAITFTKGIKARIIAVAMPFFAVMGTLQSVGVLLANCSLVILGAEHRPLGRSVVETTKLIFAAVFSIVLWVPSLFVPSIYRRPVQVFTENVTKASTICIKLKNEPDYRQNISDVNGFINQDGTKTLVCRLSTVESRKDIEEKLKSGDSFGLHCLQLEGLGALALVSQMPGESQLKKIRTLALRNDILSRKDLEILIQNHPHIKCLDLRGCVISEDLRKVSENCIVITDQSNNIQDKFNALCIAYFNACREGITSSNKGKGLRSKAIEDNPAAHFINTIVIPDGTDLSLLGKAGNEKNINWFPGQLKRCFPFLKSISITNNQSLTLEGLRQFEVGFEEMILDGCRNLCNKSDRRDFDSFVSHITVLASSGLRKLAIRKMEDLTEKYRGAIKLIRDRFKKQGVNIVILWRMPNGNS
ncbi:MAG: hypothetical protein KDK50_04975 [Chlamydiia bacterium]|nr:hypothetical protein [Chlamydiia bacterium]